MSKVVIYARHTSDIDGDPSVVDQIKTCTKEAQEAGAQVWAVYSDDAPVSSTEQRSGLMDLLRDASFGDFDIVLTERLDCLARDDNNLTKVSQRLAQYHVTVCTVLDGGELGYQIALEKVDNAKAALTRLYGAAAKWDLGLECLKASEGGQAMEREIKRIQAGFQQVVQCDPSGFAQTVAVTQTQDSPQDPESQLELAYE
ncbi:MAG: recombinase family protein [Psychrosphaera sp.]|nr:recombinase family protein [Psychrosphaera sp.]